MDAIIALRSPMRDLANFVGTWHGATSEIGRSPIGMSPWYLISATHIVQCDLRILQRPSQLVKIHDESAGLLRFFNEQVQDLVH